MADMNEKTKVKIIGVGSIGMHLARACRKKDWSVTMVGRSKEGCKRLPKIYKDRYGEWDKDIRVVDSNDSVVGGHEIIFIGTPPDVRLEWALQALSEEPKILQLEKPLFPPGANIEEFRKELGKFQGMVLAGYNHSVAESVWYAVEKIADEGVIGKVKSVDVVWREDWKGILAAHPWLSGPQDSYLGETTRGGGALCEHSHGVQMMLYLMDVFGSSGDDIITRATGMLSNKPIDCGYDEISCINVISNSGIVGRVVQDVVTFPAIKSFVVYGDKGSLSWSGTVSLDTIIILTQQGRRRTERTFTKSRQKDFEDEILHIEKLLHETGEFDEDNSPLSMRLGLMTHDLITGVYGVDQDPR